MLRRRLSVIFLLGALCLAGALLYSSFWTTGPDGREVAANRSAESAPGRAADRAGGQGQVRGNRGVGQGTSGGRAPVPVVLADAKAEPLPIRRRTIGTLESPATVIIRSRLDTIVLEQHVRDGQLVRKGDLLFTLDDREVRASLARAEAQLARDQAQLSRTELDLRRAEELLQRNAAPRTQLEQATAENKAAQATVQADQAAVDTERLRLAYTRLQAPIDGRIGSIRVSAGNLVSASNAEGLVTLTQMQPLRVNFSLAERDLQALRRAASRSPAAAVRLFSPDAADPIATGVLDFVDTSVDVSSGTIAARATFDNADLALWPGQFVEVELELDVIPDTIMIPSVALQSGQAGAFFFVAKDGRAEMRKATIVGTQGDQTAVRGGIQAGERVVVEGQFRLTNQAAILESRGDSGGARQSAAQ